MTTIRELEQILFSVFPPGDAMPDDRIGLLVGDETAELRGVALALDAKTSTISTAARLGCNALVTHHPVFWHSQKEFLKEGVSEGAAIYCAAQLDVSLIAMHTNVDCSPLMRELLLSPAGYRFEGPLAWPHETDEQLRMPRSCIVSSDSSESEADVSGGLQKEVAALGQTGVPSWGEPLSLRELTERYRAHFGAVAKVWGNPERQVARLACCSGGGGSLVQRVINNGVDCYVTGEVAYHEALELAAADVCLIELGHDLSELPYSLSLRDVLIDAGIEASLTHVLGPTAVWWQ